MANPFMPDATRAALRALTQPVGIQAEEPPPPEPKSEEPKVVARTKPSRAAQLAALSPRTVVMSDQDVLAAQEFGYMRGCRDLSAVLRAALEVLRQAEEAGIVEVEFDRKTGERGGRPVYEHRVKLHLER